MSEKIYRGVFRKSNGARLRMDFYAESRPLALSHAACVASDTHAIREHGSQLEVVRVT